LVAAATAVFEYAYRQFGRDSLPGHNLQSKNNMLIHYEDAGQGTPVILVHAMGANLGLDWVRPGIIRELSKKYRVVALDLCGYCIGDSPHDPADYGIQMVEDVVWVMDRLKIKKAHVVGYSMGGFITLKMAVLYPERMLSLTACGSGWTPNPEKDFASLRALAGSIENGGGYVPLLDFLQSRGKPAGLVRNSVVSAMMSVRNDAMDVGSMLRSVDALHVNEAELRNNKLPVLSLIGECDPFKPLADEMSAVMGNIREVVVPGGDHFSTLYKPAFLAALEKFLAENSPALAVKTGAILLWRHRSAEAA
jgi:pimeloyl-ACP methyl ester carboxylesterase